MSRFQKSGAGNVILFPQYLLKNQMTLTLLLDLDDTLLSNDMGTFIPAYLQALGNHLKTSLPPEKLIPTLLAATRAMLENNRPDRTLKQVFDQAFYPSLGVDPEQLRQPIESFYQESFPSLRNLTNPIPGAVDFVEAAINKGYRIAIATNPLFPRTAVLQRLQWAGLSPDIYPFLLIPSYEILHFAKPNPAYFAEVLAYLGWTDGQVLMVGDDPQLDFDASRRYGLAAYWINRSSSDYPTQFLPPTAAGKLTDLQAWIDSLPEKFLEPKNDHHSSYLFTLRATPAAVETIIQEKTDKSLKERPTADEWCTTEVICHLRDVDNEINLPRIKCLIKEDNPFLPGVDSDQWAIERDYFHQDGRKALNDFMVSRIELLDLLEQLNPQDWNRTARHAIFGPTNLKELIRISSGHDRVHLHQIHTCFLESPIH
jgi:FMN phosphatase YigB (HAD superfamily)